MRIWVRLIAGSGCLRGIKGVLRILYRERVERAEMKDKESGKVNVRSGGIILAVIIAMLFLWFAAYQLVTGRIIDLSVENMKELSKHDAQTIETTVSNTLETLLGIGNELRQEKPADVEALCDELSIRKNLVAADRLMLFAADGQAVNSNRKIYTDEAAAGLLPDSDDHIIYRLENKNVAVAGRREVMIIGSRIRPFTVSGVTYEWVIASMDIDMLLDDVKLDSFEGEGASVVVTRTGEYLLEDTVNFDSQNAANIFEDRLSQVTYKRGVAEEDVRAALEGNTELAFEFQDKNGRDYVMLIIPMAEGEWNFCMCVPRAVFERQSQSLILIFTLLMFLVMVIVVSVILIISRKNAQAAVAEQRRQVEEQHRQELAEALTMAQSANRAKTTFLNNMSHDIRTPMNAIIGYTALATTHIDNREQVINYLAKIAQSSNHLLSLINDVLDMSRIESGRMNLSEQPESLSEILLSLKNIIQADVNAKQLELFIDAEDIADEEIYCDKLRLNQVLLNILSNAIKYTHPGGKVSFRISQRASSREGYGTFEFRVKDNGIGMSAEFVKTIFDPFTREQTSTVSGIQGTGLGMSITKNIVEMMGGTITVESEEKKGTEFVVTLEFKLQENQKEPKRIESLEGIRGLVVDDDMNVCRNVSKMLIDIGMRSEWCTFGKEAVARTEDACTMGDPFGVYIIDWLMPDMNGIETARRIRKIVGNDAPIIILSAYDWSDIESEAREAGVTDFISKPMFPSSLRELLLRCCAEPEPEEETEKTAFDFTGRRILLVEDNELNREIATVLLEEAGILVETAENGSRACEILQKEEPGYFDLVLMDVQMPVMDGYEATKAIRQFNQKELAEIPVIAMTANAFAEDRQKALEAGMDGYIAKPIDIKALFETIEEIITQRSTEEEK